MSESKHAPGPFVADGDWLQGPKGAIAIAPPRISLNGETHDQTKARYQGLIASLASALNAAQALLDKIDDNPALFFGMEDTCQDEFDDLSAAIARAA